MKRTGKFSFEPRIRFNWGFHDAQHDKATGVCRSWRQKGHFDKAYEAGYYAGLQSSDTTSDAAWRAR